MNLQETENVSTRRTTWSGVVILVPKHVAYLEDVLFDLRNQSMKFDEIIIVASGFINSRERDTLEKITRESGIKDLKILLRPLAPAGSNRNAGAQVATCDYVVFMDGDDRYFHFRNQRLKEIQLKFNFDLLLHTSINFNEPKQLLHMDFSREAWSGQSPRFWETPSLFMTTFPDGARDRELEMGGANTNIVTPAVDEVLPIHHGHSVVRRQSLATIQFHEKYFPRNEDGVFVRDMLFAKRRIVVTDEMLSAYRTYSSASSWKSSIVLNILKPAMAKMRSVLRK